MQWQKRLNSQSKSSTLNLSSTTISPLSSTTFLSSFSKTSPHNAIRIQLQSIRFTPSFLAQHLPTYTSTYTTPRTKTSTSHITEEIGMNFTLAFRFWHDTNDFLWKLNTLSNDNLQHYSRHIVTDSHSHFDLLCYFKSTLLPLYFYKGHPTNQNKKVFFGISFLPLSVFIRGKSHETTTGLKLNVFYYDSDYNLIPFCVS